MIKFKYESIRSESMEYYGFGPEEMKKHKVCPTCGAESNPENCYCPVCGEKLPDETLFDLYCKEHYCCPICGCLLEENDRFCPHCGQNLDQIKTYISGQNN